MDRDNGGGNTPPIHERGDAPEVTRLIKGEEIKKKTRYSSWSSPEVYARHISEINPDSIWYKRYGDVWNNANESFSGVKNIQEAIDLCRNGWREGGETIERTRSYVRALNPTLPKPIRYAIAGSTPNVPRAVAGNILNMRLPEVVKSSRNKVITIVYNMCESGIVSKEAITNKAAVMAALIDVIEEKGYACEVICTARSDNRALDDYLSIVVKPSHQPVDTNRLAFSLGHSAMFRVMMFADWESDPICEELGWGLGHASSTEPTKEQNEKHIYTIQSCNRIETYFEDMETSASIGVKSLIDELATQGCPAFPKKDHEDGLDKNEEDDPEEDYDEYDF